MKRSARRMAVVSMVTGGLLLVGLTPAFADDPGEQSTDLPVGGETTSQTVAEPEIEETDAEETEAVAASPEESAVDGGASDAQSPRPADGEALGLEDCDPTDPEDPDCPELPEDCDGDDIPDPQGCGDEGDGDCPDPTDTEDPDCPDLPEFDDCNGDGVPDPEGCEDPGEDDPGEDDPGEDDPGNDNPGNGEPGNGEPGNGESGNGEPGNDEPGTGTNPGDSGTAPGGGGVEGGPGTDPEQAKPEGVVPGAEVQQSSPQLEACTDPSLCQELEDEEAVTAAADTSAAAPMAAGDELAETGAQAPVPASWLTAAGALLVLAGGLLLRAQRRPRGVHRA